MNIETLIHQPDREASATRIVADGGLGPISSRGSAEEEYSNDGTTFALTGHIPCRNGHLTSASEDSPQGLLHLDLGGTRVLKLMQGQSTIRSSNSGSALPCCAMVADTAHLSVPLSRYITSPRPSHAHEETRLPSKLESRGNWLPAQQRVVATHPTQDHAISHSTAITTATTSKLPLHY